MFRLCLEEREPPSHGWIGSPTFNLARELELNALDKRDSLFGFLGIFSASSISHNGNLNQSTCIRFISGRFRSI